MKKITLVHIINGLHQGGAETALFRLISGLDQRYYDITVISLSTEGTYDHKISDLGVNFYRFPFNRFSFFKPFISLTRCLYRLRPDCITTWMYHSNLIGGIAGRFVGCRNIIWNIRSSGVYLKLSTSIVNRICAALSSILPKKIIGCSQFSIKNHIMAGYDKSKFIYIPNGVDTDLFTPSQNHPEHDTFGMLSRYHPRKGFFTFLKAIPLVNRYKPASFIMAGTGVSESDDLDIFTQGPEFRSLKRLPAFSETPLFYHQLSFFISPSDAEAFPNVVAEAMSCGLPCIVTDVGDSALIVGDTGIIVPPNHPEAIAEACITFLKLSQDQRKKLSNKARDRVLTHFTIKKMIESYHQLYISLKD